MTYCRSWECDTVSYFSSSSSSSVRGGGARLVVVNDFHDLISSVCTLGTVAEQTTSPSHRVSLSQLRTSLDIVDSGFFLPNQQTYALTS